MLAHDTDGARTVGTKCNDFAKTVVGKSVKLKHLETVHH